MSVQPGLGTPASARSAGDNTANATGPRAQARSRRRQQGLTPLGIGVAVITMILGMAIGGFIVSQRHKAAQLVAAVNGAPITQDLLLHQLIVADATQGTRVLPKLLQDELVVQFAKKKGVAPTEAEITARVNEEIKKPDFAKKMAASHAGMADVRRLVQVYLSQAKLFSSGETVSEAEIRAVYDKMSSTTDPNAKFYTPESCNIALIITKTKDDADKASAMFARGMSFDAVAKDKTFETSRKQRAFIAQPSNVIVKGRTKYSKIPGWEDFIFQQKSHIGKPSEPQQFAKAWWIVQCNSWQPHSTLSYPSVHDECRTAALLQKSLSQKQNLAANQRTAEEFRSFRRTSTVQAFWPEYKDAVTKTASQ